MSKTTVSLDDIQSIASQALSKHGASEWVATEVAKAIRKAEATGNVICGLYYLESYCKQLQSGRVKGSIEPIISVPRTATVKADAGFGFAQPAFAKALPIAIETVNNTGTCSLAVCHAHTCTSLGYFTEQIAEAGYIGIGFTNASAVVSPPGATMPSLAQTLLRCPYPHNTVALHFSSTKALVL